MALPASGAISLSQVSVELGAGSTSTRSLNDSTTRTLFGVASGQISLSQGYGKANTLAVEYLIVAGGGSGGTDSGAGGGAGGYRTASADLAKATGFSIVIGAGGSSRRINGANSSFNGLVSTGGGYGGYYASTLLLTATVVAAVLVAVQHSDEQWEMVFLDKGITGVLVTMETLVAVEVHLRLGLLMKTVATVFNG